VDSLSLPLLLMIHRDFDDCGGKIVKVQAAINLVKIADGSQQSCGLFERFGY
jgi:hypothetical protein